MRDTRTPDRLGEGRDIHRPGAPRGVDHDVGAGERIGARIVVRERAEAGLLGDDRQAVRRQGVGLARDLQAAEVAVRRTRVAGRLARAAAARSCRSRRCARRAHPRRRRRTGRRAERSSPSRTATSVSRMPWMRVLNSWNSSCPGGGWMSHPAVATTRPPRTRASPTAQADAVLEFAVSKSIAVKSMGTGPASRAVRKRRRRRAALVVGSEHGRSRGDVHVVRCRRRNLRVRPAGVSRRGGRMDAASRRIA